MALQDDSSRRLALQDDEWRKLTLQDNAGRPPPEFGRLFNQILPLSYTTIFSQLAKGYSVEDRAHPSSSQEARWPS